MEAGVIVSAKQFGPAKVDVTAKVSGLELVDTPDVVKGTVLTLVLAGCLSIAFMGFAGLGA